MDKRVNTNNEDYELTEGFFSEILLLSDGLSVTRYNIKANTSFKFDKNDSIKLTALFFPKVTQNTKIFIGEKSILQHIYIIDCGESLRFNQNIIFYSFDFDEEWLNTNLSIEQTELLNGLFELPTKSIVEVPINIIKANELTDFLENDELNTIFGYLHVSNQIILEIINALFIKPKEAELNISLGEVERLYGVRQKLLTSNTPPENIEQLAMIAGMSTTKFKTSFKKLFGQSPYSYFLSIRMNKAKDLIVNHKKTVSEVSEEFGYNHISNFTKIFKKYTTQLPSKINVQNQ
ncbi:MAG: helix-turn-helix transcriptional regulator [Spirosomaceae bacterium]|nr:helix-turn-helix transcriptional regulator [Spirosomataceae bacterium]